MGSGRYLQRLWREQKVLILFNVVLIGFFWAMIYTIYDSPFQMAGHTHDAQGYLLIADWLTGGYDSGHPEIRPLLYPAFVLLVKSFMGEAGVLFGQFVLWLLSINFTYLAVRKLTRKHWLALGAGVLLASNLSYLALTAHALSEVATTTLVAYGLYHLLDVRDRLSNYEWSCHLVLMTGVLTLVRPVFFLPFLAAVGLSLWWFLKLRKPKCAVAGTVANMWTACACTDDLYADQIRCVHSFESRG